jgi:hypothetical protein
MEKGIFVNAIIPQRMGTALSGLTKVCNKIRVMLTRNDVRELQDPLKADIDTLRNCLESLRRHLRQKRTRRTASGEKAADQTQLAFTVPPKALDDAGGEHRLSFAVL